MFNTQTVYIVFSCAESQEQINTSGIKFDLLLAKAAHIIQYAVRAVTTAWPKEPRDDEERERTAAT